MLKALKAGNVGNVKARCNASLLLLLSLFIVVSATPNMAAAQETGQEEGWQFEVAPYMWAASIGATTASGSDIEIDFGDIISNLDMTFMGAFGVHKGKWSLLTDVMYLNISDDDQGTLTVPIGSGFSVGTDASVELSSWIVTPVVSYNIMQTEKASLDVLGGARYLWMKNDIKLKISGPLGTRQERVTESGDVWDGIVGIRGKVNLNEKWYLPYHADIGTGETDLTWQALGGVGYRFGKVDLVLGYRHMEWNFDDNSVFDDLEISGPYAGFKFVF